MIQNLSISNAAGTCKDIDGIKKLLSSAVTYVRLGSITVEEELGNQGQVFHYDERTGNGYNAIGLKNPGVRYYAKHLADWNKMVQDAGKQLSVSIAPLQLGDTARLTEVCLEAQVTSLELNPDCPNIISGTQVKKPLSFDLVHLEKEVKPFLHLCAQSYHQVEACLKLSASLPLEHIGDITSLVGYMSAEIYPLGIVFSNTARSEGFFSNRQEVLRYKSSGSEDRDKIYHSGGLSGQALLEQNLVKIALLRHSLPTAKIDGVGGISAGAHMIRYLQQKADRVQVGLEYYRTENPRVFSDILEGAFRIRDAHPELFD